MEKPTTQWYQWTHTKAGEEPAFFDQRTRKGQTEGQKRLDDRHFTPATTTGNTATPVNKVQIESRLPHCPVYSKAPFPPSWCQKSSAGKAKLSRGNEDLSHRISADQVGNRNKALRAFPGRTGSASEAQWGAWISNLTQHIAAKWETWTSNPSGNNKMVPSLPIVQYQRRPAKTQDLNNK